MFYIFLGTLAVIVSVPLVKNEENIEFHPSPCGDEFPAFRTKRVFSKKFKRCSWKSKTSHEAKRPQKVVKHLRVQVFLSLSCIDPMISFFCKPNKSRVKRKSKRWCNFLTTALGHDSTLKIFACFPKPAFGFFFLLRLCERCAGCCSCFFGLQYFSSFSHTQSWVCCFCVFFFGGYGELLLPNSGCLCMHSIFFSLASKSFLFCFCSFSFLFCSVLYISGVRQRESSQLTIILC